MKKIIITLLILSTFLIGCSNLINADTAVATSKAETKAETVTVTSIVEVENIEKIEKLNGQLEDMTARLSLSEEEKEKYDYLIRNLNNLLKNVYYGYASNDKYILDGFTAFSICHKDKYYIITVGHCVENEDGKFRNFKFKANFSDEWIYPKLLDYKYNGNTLDYAIFGSDRINNGFVTFNNDISSRKYILGSTNNNLNVLKEFTHNGLDGECGSPVINLNQEIIGVFTGNIIYIKTVLEAIDNLK